MAKDNNNIITNVGGYVELELYGNNEDFVVPIDLTHGGHHFEGVPKHIVQAYHTSYPERALPRTLLHDFIVAGHWEGPYGISNMYH